MLPLNTIDYVRIKVTDLKQAQEWYKHVLGLTPDPRYQQRMHPENAMTLLANPSGTVRLALTLADAIQHQPGSIVFSVGGQVFLAWIDALAGERVKDSAGQTIARDSVSDHGLFFSIPFCDPFGNAYEIISYDHTWLLGKLQHGEHQIKPHMAVQAEPAEPPSAYSAHTAPARVGVTLN